MKFKVGDEVVCLKDCQIYESHQINKGQIYYVTHTYDDYLNDNSYHLVEVSERFGYPNELTNPFAAIRYYHAELFALADHLRLNVENIESIV